MFDRFTGRPRGFGFITFDYEDVVDKVLHKNVHQLKNKQVETKRALPKEICPAVNGFGGGYVGYGSLSPIGFLQPNVGGYAPYNDYVGPYYGYDLYTCYGGAAGVYRNPVSAGSGYASGSPGAMRNPYHRYGEYYDSNAGYEATSLWSGSANHGGASASASESQGHSSQNVTKEDGYSTHTGGSTADFDDSETDDWHTGNAPNSCMSGASTQAGQHEANGHKTTMIYGSSNGSPRYPEVY